MKISPNIKIIVAFHQPCQVPSDEMYLPLLLGASLQKEQTSKGEEIDILFERDDSGENISALNSSFSELTGLYWAWKNIRTDYIGLVHYRRYFYKGGRVNRRDLFSSILKYEDINKDLGKAKIFLPKKRKYYIETIYSHYAHTHYAEHLDKARNVIEELYPEYLPCCDKVFRARSGYMFNIMIMEQEMLDNYCGWLFDILFSLKDRIQTENLSDYEKRLFGRISEILFNVWLDYQMETGRIQKNEIKELPLLYTQKTNWRKKILAFLKAKYLGVKYEESL